jgi:acetolactate synthase-1/2/3 large subunit
MNGAEALVKTLAAEGVETIFGISGGMVIPIHDVLYDRACGVKHILTRHEQGAAHMADGYARASGRVGVCMATSGPGATNLVTGIANASMDSVPIVAITGQVRTTAMGKDAFQETDITGITLPIVKHSYLLKRSEDVARVVHEAFYVARTGRPGPVVIDIPWDVSMGQIDWQEPTLANLRGYRVPGVPDPDAVRAAAQAINAAERPLLYIGGGVITAGASELVRALADKCSLFVTNTLLGKGGFPETHERSLGMLGMHGTAYGNYAMHHCDLIVAVGARFDDRVTGKLETFAPEAKVVHIDVDVAEIGKSVSVDYPIAGNAGEALELLIEQVEPRERGVWEDRLAAWKGDHPLHYPPSESGHPRPQHVAKRLFELTEGAAICATDVGQHQMWAAQYYLCDRPRQFLSSGGLGTMGFGFPAAIGAKVACPEDEVILMAGDGSIQMNIQELATAVRERLAVKVFVFNNGWLGMVRQWQDLMFERRYAGVDLECNPDFVKLAEAYGAVGLRAEREDQLDDVIREALAVEDGPCLVDVHVEPEENVFPMIAAGKTVEEMWLGDPREGAEA